MVRKLLLKRVLCGPGTARLLSELCSQRTSGDVSACSNISALTLDLAPTVLPILIWYDNLKLRLALAVSVKTTSAVVHNTL